MSGGALERPSRNPFGRRCVLCRCRAVDDQGPGQLWGYPVCGYHLEHGEDDPECPDCREAGEALHRVIRARGGRCPECGMHHTGSC